jgi:hypothetical protein
VLLFVLWKVVSIDPALLPYMLSSLTVLFVYRFHYSFFFNFTLPVFLKAWTWKLTFIGAFLGLARRLRRQNSLAHYSGLCSYIVLLLIPLF